MVVVVFYVIVVVDVIPVDVVLVVNVVLTIMLSIVFVLLSELAFTWSVVIANGDVAVIAFYIF